MSAFIVSVTHIRALVTVASKDTYGQIPPLPGDFIRKWPAAFPAFLQPPFGTKSPDWLEHLISAPMQRGWSGFEDELGRALWLANLESVNYRYREKGGAEEIMAFKFAPVRLPMVDIIKACHCFDYQSCEIPDWDTAWAKQASAAIREIAIRLLPGYEAAPWGIYDTPEVRSEAVA